MLHDIDFDHLMLWGHNRLALTLHQRLHGHLTDLGQITTTIDHYQQALTIARDTGNRRGESHRLSGLGECFADQGAWRASVEQCREAIEVADGIGYVQVQCEARLSLAQSHLLAGDPDARRTAAEDAVAHDYPRQRAQAHLLIGIAQLRQGAHSDDHPVGGPPAVHPRPRRQFR